jgi:hypothetical protein
VFLADQVQTKTTTLGPDEVIMRSVQYFTTGKWRTQSQSQRIATFVGRPAVPILYVLLTITGILLCIVPGIIMYILLLRKAMQLQNIVVTANPMVGGTEVIVKHSSSAKKLVGGFLEALP